MSIVAMSDTVGSLGDEVGRAVARALGYEFADREIIKTAAARFGESVLDLQHAAEEKPKLWERFAAAQHRYRAYIEATVFALAARDNTVLVGRASPIVLGRTPHTLRVRVDAPESLRARRVEQREGLTRDSALSYMRQTDRDRAARVRFSYGVELGDPLLYDLVLDTERLDVVHCARLIEKTLEHERFRSTTESLRAMQDQSLLAQARAALLAHATTRPRRFGLACADGVITLEGGVDAAQVRQAAEDVVARIPGVTRVQNEIVVAFEPIVNEAEELSHHQFRHGEERSWGGYGGGWYDREWEARRRLGQDSDRVA